MTAVKDGRVLHHSCREKQQPRKERKKKKREKKKFKESKAQTKYKQAYQKIFFCHGNFSMQELQKHFFLFQI